jgi:hypothetical protein
MALGGSAMSSVSSCKTNTQMWLCSLKHTYVIKTSWEVLYSKLSLLSNRPLLGQKRRNCRCSWKGIPHNHANPHSLVSVEATGVCIPIGNSELSLAAVYKSPGRAGSDADNTELLSFMRKSLLAGDLRAKHPFWNSAVSNPSSFLNYSLS